MTGFVLFLAYALLCVILLGVLYWVFEQVSLPQPIKIAIIGIIVVVGVIYFIQGGYLTQLPHR